MTDQEHAAAIKKAAAELQSAIYYAHAEGLQVDVDTERVTEYRNFKLLSAWAISVQVSRPL